MPSACAPSSRLSRSNAGAYPVPRHNSVLGISRRLRRALHPSLPSRRGPAAHGRDAPPLGLLLNETKTGIVCLTQGKQGLDFLGFHLHKVASWKWKGRFYLQRWPSQKAMASIRGKIKAATDRANVGKSLETVVRDLNRTLKGWGNHFRYGNS